MGWHTNPDTLSIAAEQGRRERMRRIVQGDPYEAEKVAKAVEVEERLRLASWHGRRANRAPENNPEPTD